MRAGDGAQFRVASDLGKGQIFSWSNRTRFCGAHGYQSLTALPIADNVWQICPIAGLPAIHLAGGLATLYDTLTRILCERATLMRPADRFVVGDCSKPAWPGDSNRT